MAADVTGKASDRSFSSAGGGGVGSGARRQPAESPLRDERALVEGLLAGDHAVLSEFLSRTHHPVFAMACRLTYDRELRQDWTHETLLGILTDLKGGRFILRQPGSFWSWFRKRAYYRLLDQYRLHRRRQSRERGEGSESESYDLERFPGGEDPVSELLQTEVLAALETCLRGLRNPDHRRALGFLLFHEMTYEEIAATLPAPLNTVRAWIRRGRLALRRCLVERLQLDRRRGASV